VAHVALVTDTAMGDFAVKIAEHFAYKGVGKGREQERKLCSCRN